MLRENPELASARDGNGISVIMHAFYAGQREIAEMLIAAKPGLDEFEVAAAGDAGKMAELLKRNPVVVKNWSPDGFTALHFAAFFNRPEIARQLISHGSDVNVAARNTMKVTPLHSAAAARSREIVRLLLEHGADADARQQGGWRAVHAAAQNGDFEMVRDLLQRGADPVARNDDGKTPGEMAAEKGHSKVVDLLSK